MVFQQPNNAFAFSVLRKNFASSPSTMSTSRFNIFSAFYVACFGNVPIADNTRRYSKSDEIHIMADTAIQTSLMALIMTTTFNSSFHSIPGGHCSPRAGSTVFSIPYDVDWELYGLRQNYMCVCPRLYVRLYSHINQTVSFRKPYTLGPCTSDLRSLSQY